MCAYRGYFQGLQNMKPTALSQIIEQFVKVAAGLALAYLLLKWTGRMEFGAMGALLGITISEAVALLYTMGAYGRQKRQMTEEMMRAYKSRLTRAEIKPLLGKVLILALPVTVAGLVMPIVAFVDSVIIPRSLLALGYESAAVRSMYGTLSGGVLTIINLAAIVSQALQMSVVPAISEALKLGDNERVKANVLRGIKFAFLEGIPVTVAFFVFASPIFSFLYPSSTPAQHELATGLLMTMCSVAVFLPFMQTMTGVLQGIGKQNLPPVALAVGAGVKIGLSLFLMSIPQINIYGAVIGTVMCYIIAAVMNYLFVRKYTGVRIKWGEHLLKPIAATAVMAAAAYLVYSLIAPYSNAVDVYKRQLFYRVQARLEKNKRAPATAKADVDYLLTTKLFCGLCERMMIGESGTSHTGDKHYYYKCAGAKRKLGCKKKSAKKDFIERAAVVLTVNRVLKDEEIDRIADGILALQNSEDTTIPALKKQLADTERGIENMLNAIQQGVLTSSTKERLEALEKQRDNLKIAVLQAELQKPKYTKEPVSYTHLMSGEKLLAQNKKAWHDYFIDDKYEAGIELVGT